MRTACVLAGRMGLLLGVAAGCGPQGPVPEPRIQVTIMNDGSVPICDVYMRPSSHFAAGWSNDWLDRDETVVPGARRSFSVAPGETWDVRLDACGGATVRTVTGETWSTHATVAVSGSP